MQGDQSTRDMINMEIIFCPNFEKKYGRLVKVGPAGPAHLSSGLLKMTDFSCGLILPKISQQPARQPVAGRLRIPAQNEAHLGAPSGDST